jgi:hypothetical protein
MEKIIICKEFDDLKSNVDKIIEDLKKDAIEFYNKDNGTAGLRLRKSLKALGVHIKSVSDKTLPKNLKNN